MSEDAKRVATGRRGKVVGRRLPWNRDNFESLRAMSWQVHAYGDIASGSVDELEAALGLQVNVFTQVRNRRLLSGNFYLVRPDGFVAATAPAESAVAVFATQATHFLG